jgi:protein-tyrosine phosphatase
VIDIHTHLLPGVDDGSPSIDVSVEVLQRFAGEGVEVLVCTPHLRASQIRDAPYAHYLEILTSLRHRAPNPPRLELGWEIMLDRPGCDLRSSMLGLAGRRAVLVEFPRTNLPAGATGELERIATSGRTPVVAHPERYRGCSLHLVREWREVGAVIQTDATMLLGRSPLAELAKSLLEEGLIDCLASDNHGDRRSLSTTRDWLREAGGDEQAELLTRLNGQRLLSDAPVLPVPPMKLARGMLTRLRQMVFGPR